MTDLQIVFIFTGLMVAFAGYRWLCGRVAR
jgi:hypothetical protein